MAKKYCDVPKCGNEIPEGRGSMGGLEVCNRCRSAVYHWRKVGSKGLQAYTESLEFRASRADYVQPLIGRILKRARERVAEARANVH